MLGSNFTYAGHSLSEYSMTLYDPESEQQFVGRDIDRSDITSLRAIPNHYSTRYNGVLILSFFIIKDGTIQESRRMSGDDINTIRAWLESPKSPSLLTVAPLTDDEDEEEEEEEEEDTTVNYYGLFTEIQPFILRQECYGLYLTFTCNSPYGFTDVVEKEFTLATINLLAEDGTNLLDESDSVIVAEDVNQSGTYVNNSAEHNEYLRPIITITSTNKFVSGESITIKNISDGNKTMFLLLPKNKSSIVIDCQKKTIVDNNGNLIPLSEVGLSDPISNDYNYISAELYSFYWLRLLYGTNNLTFSCPGGSTVAKVKIGARQINKSGGF